MGKINNILNGKTVGILITIFMSLLTFAVTIYTVGQITGQYKEKVDTLEKTTIPKLEVKIETNDVKRQHDMDEIRRLFKTIDSTTLDNYYVLKDIKKDIVIVKKKLKIE